MLIVGSDDGVYRFGDIDGGAGEPRKVLDSGRVMRLRTFEAVVGAFAATRTGLYHTRDGETWTELGVPRDQVYAVGASPAGDRLYVGTRPAAVYVTDVGDGPRAEDPGWRELAALQTLPSRESWRLPRHEDIAQVRDVHALDAGRVVVGVEVGGVHLGHDGGATFDERRAGVDPDIHELHAAGNEEWIAATGTGLYRTVNAGRTWNRLDEGVVQSYFRAAIEADGVVYGAGAMSNSSTWEDPDADPELFAWRGETLEPVSLPTDDETVTGLATVGGTVVAGTHRGSLLIRRADGWERAGAFPVPGELTGRYTPLAACNP